MSKILACCFTRCFSRLFVVCCGVFLSYLFIAHNNQNNMAAYDRRAPSHYHRGGGGNPLPSSYRNKALLVVAATAAYTAFLYHSGMLCLVWFKSGVKME